MARNHKLEWAQRKKLAKARGYNSVRDQRKALEEGLRLPIRPGAVHNPDTQQVWAQLVDKQREASADWSAAHAAKSVARFTPRQAKRLGMSEVEYVTAYYAAWVGGPEAYGKVRYKGGSAAHKHWLVDVYHSMTAEEYDERYASKV